jgi:hypothetical protein
MTVENAGDIGAAAAQAAGVPSGSGEAPSPNAPAGTPPVGTGPAPQSVAAPSAAQRQYAYAEDRSNWVPPHRLREESTRAREAAARVQQYERDLHYERQRVAALSGVQPPPAPTDPENEIIRAQFLKIFPEYAKLAKLADRADQLAAFDPSQVMSAQDQQYEIMGNQALARLNERAQELFGGELGPLAKQSLEMTFGAWVHANPELHSRYAMQDPKLFDDFFTLYRKEMVDPHRRQSTLSTAPRDRAVPRLPRSGPGSNIPGPGPRTLKPTDTDEYHGAAFRALQ